MRQAGRPRLLMLTSSFPNAADDETCGYIREFARTLAADFEVTVLAPPDVRAESLSFEEFRLCRSWSPLPNAIDPLQATVDFNSLSSRGIWVKAGVAVSLAAFVVRAFTLAFRSDVICSHWLLPSGLAGSIIGRLLRKSHISVEHSGAIHLLARSGFGHLVLRLIAAGTQRMITVSEGLRRRLLDMCPEAVDRVEVIPMGVSLSRQVRETRQRQVCIPTTNRDEACKQVSVMTIGFVGRLTEIKGVDVLLRAVAGVQSVRLLIAGDGDARERLEAAARRLEIDASFLGQIDAPRRQRLLNECDALVVPSVVLNNGRTEGMPVVCLEAMAAGLPVIASRAGGLAELIVDGQNGLLFEPGNAGDLARKIAILSADPNLYRRLCENALLTAQRFDWARIGRRYTRAIRESLRIHEPGIYDQRWEQGSSGY
jgi:glycosyltransferase involved in cell wall biosynthesis